MNWAAWTIAKREFKSLFVSPIAYVVLGLFALASGILFRMGIMQFDRFLTDPEIKMQMTQNPDVLNFININSFLVINVTQITFTLLMVSIPFFTMRLLTEERAQHTYELLMTSPCTAWDIVLGKFMAATGFLLMCLLTHGVFVAVMFIFGNPEPLPVASSYLGLFLAGLSLISIGLFSSSITNHQIIAVIVAFAITLGFVMISWGADNTTDNLSLFLQRAALSANYEKFNRGVVQLSSLVYFVSLILLFLTASQISVRSIARK